MTVKEAYNYLPQDKGAQNAYDRVIKKYVYRTTVEDLKRYTTEEIGVLASDYVTASVAYFANHSDDPILEDVGTTAWHAINKRRVLTAYADDARVGAIRCGLPPQFARRVLPDEPNFGVYKNRETQTYYGAIVIPPQFIERAGKKPVESLAALLSMLSQVRDLERGKLFTDTKMAKQRSWAIESEFLLQQLKQKPDLELGPIYKEVIRRFPEGIKSLPESARY